jgi:autotransporter-associated beta strand protein
VSGTWTASSSGNWSDSGNWQSGNVANGTNNTATFNPGAAVTVTVDGNRFIGALTFTGFDSTLAGTDTLKFDNTTFTQPQVSVASGLTATLATDIGGTLGLEKTDPGTLVLTGTKSYTGDTTVTGGTLELQGATGGTAQIHGALTVSPGATVAFTAGDGTGFGFLNNPVTSFTVDGGTINAVSGSHLGFGSAATLSLENGGSLQGSWQWNGDSLLSFSSFGDTTNTISGLVVLRADAGANHTFSVDDGASATDLQINAVLSDEWPENNAVPASDLTKTGTGTLVLAGANTYNGNTVVNDGALGVTAAGSLQFRPTTNGTTNSVSGSATASLSFLGTVDLDLGAADATLNNSWNLFNLGSFSTTPDLSSIAAVTSSLGSFTEVTPGTWELPVIGAKWVFTESNGNLAYVNAATDYDTWKTANGVTGGQNDDDDSDGLNNLEEYAFGLDPTGGSSINPIVSQFNKSTGKFSYTRRKPQLGTGLTYSVWFSTNLATWTEDTGATESTPVPSGDNETVEVTLSSLPGSPLPAKLFIQVRAN